MFFMLKNPTNKFCYTEGQGVRYKCENIYQVRKNPQYVDYDILKYQSSEISKSIDHLNRGRLVKLKTLTYSHIPAVYLLP